MAKRLLQSIGEKNFGKCWLASPIVNHQLTVNEEAIPNINEYNKTNSVFSRICLVPRASNMLFDDGEVHCRVYDLWLSQITIWKTSEIYLFKHAILLFRSWRCEEVHAQNIVPVIDRACFIIIFTYSAVFVWRNQKPL